MSELKKVLWKLHHRRKYIGYQSEHSKLDADRYFWLGEKVGTDQAIFLIEQSIWKEGAIT